MFNSGSRAFDNLEEEFVDKLVQSNGTQILFFQDGDFNIIGNLKFEANKKILYNGIDPFESKAEDNEVVKLNGINQTITGTLNLTGAINLSNYLNYYSNIDIALNRDAKIQTWTTTTNSNGNQFFTPFTNKEYCERQGCIFDSQRVDNFGSPIAQTLAGGLTFLDGSTIQGNLIVDDIVFSNTNTSIVRGTALNTGGDFLCLDDASIMKSRVLRDSDNVVLKTGTQNDIAGEKTFTNNLKSTQLIKAGDYLEIFSHSAYTGWGGIRNTFCNGNDDYALLQHTGGNIQLNSKAGSTASITINGTLRFRATSNQNITYQELNFEDFDVYSNTKIKANDEEMIHFKQNDIDINKNIIMKNNTDDISAIRTHQNTNVNINLIQFVKALTYPDFSSLNVSFFNKFESLDIVNYPTIQISNIGNAFVIRGSWKVKTGFSNVSNTFEDLVYFQDYYYPMYQVYHSLGVIEYRIVNIQVSGVWSAVLQVRTTNSGSGNSISEGHIGHFIYWK